MNSFEELMQKAKDLPKEKFVRETQAAVNAETELKKRCLADINNDIQRFKKKYLQTAENYKGQKIHLNISFFHYEKKENADLYLYLWTYCLSSFQEDLSAAFKDVACTTIVQTDPKSNVYDEIELDFYK